jgi:hypothetical protein
MVAGLAFLATAIATLFAQATAVRWSRTRAPHQGAWTIALALFALASAALATGASTGWDVGTFRAFYLLGAILNVPWLALGTIYLLAGRKTGNVVRVVLLLFTGLATGVMLAAPVKQPIAVDKLPVGKEHFGVLPRALAGAGSGIGAAVVLGGAIWSAVRFGRRRAEGMGRLAGGNALIALGTLILSSGGLLQGIAGHDESFAITLATGIAVIYLGFAVASGQRRLLSLAPDDDASSRRSNLPLNDLGNSATTSTRVGSL